MPAVLSASDTSAYLKVDTPVYAGIFTLSNVAISMSIPQGVRASTTPPLIISPASSVFASPIAVITNGELNLVLFIITVGPTQRMELVEIIRSPLMESASAPEARSSFKTVRISES